MRDLVINLGYGRVMHISPSEVLYAEKSVDPRTQQLDQFTIHLSSSGAPVHVRATPKVAAWVKPFLI